MIPDNAESSHQNLVLQNPKVYIKLSSVSNVKEFVIFFEMLKDCIEGWYI